MICSLNATICTGDVIFYNGSYGISFGGVEKCSESCGGYDMVPLQRSILKYTIIAFSILTLISSAICLAFYIRNYRKIHHPEAPIYYISICYFGIALVHILSSVLPANSFRCDETITNAFNNSVLLHNSFKSPLCVILFAVLYYFTLASWVWGCIAAIEWFIFSVRMRSIPDRLLLLMHLIGWSSPIPLLIGVVVSQSVSGNYSLQTCWISDRSDGSYQMSFVIAPSLLIVAINGTVLVVGYSLNIYKSRKISSIQFVSQRNQTLQKGINDISRTVLHNSKISMFSVVFLIVLSISMGCNFYEYTYHSQWERTYLETRLHYKHQLCYPDSETHSGYIITFYIIRFLSLQVTGIITLPWAFKRYSLCSQEKTKATPEQQHIIITQRNRTVQHDLHHSIASGSISSID